VLHGHTVANYARDLQALFEARGVQRPVLVGVNQTFQDYRTFLAEVHIPTLVFFGRDNKMTPPEAGEYIASQIAGAKLQIFEHSSHVPFYEEADAFNEVVRAFVDQVA